MRSLTRRSQDQAGSIFDAEARRRGENEKQPGLKEWDLCVCRAAEGAEKEEEDVRAALGWQAEACPTHAAEPTGNGQTPGANCGRMDRPEAGGLSYCDLKAASISTW